MSNDTKKIFNRKFTTPHIIAYIDFLGVKSMLKSNKQNIAVNTFSFIFSTITEIIEKLNKKDKTITTQIKYKIFSDNVIFAVEYNQSTFLYDVIALLGFISAFQSLVISDFGFLLRGGVCTGDLYIDDNFVLGPGLVSAYYMENKLAIYPRIIVDTDIVRKIDLSGKLPTCFCGKDNLFYINYLRFSDQNQLTKHYNQILHRSNGIYDPKVKQKYDWVKGYHNKIADLLGESLKFTDVYETTFPKNVSINKDMNFTNRFKTATEQKQTASHNEGYATMESETANKWKKPICANGVFYSENYFSQVGLYSETPYIYLYKDKLGTEFVTLSDINIVSARSGSFTNIAIRPNGKWIFSEWNTNSKNFEDKASGRFVFDVKNNEAYISLSDYESKIKPILDKYINNGAQ